MATGVTPALEAKVDNKPKASEASQAKVTLKDRIIGALGQIFAHNENHEPHEHFGI